VTDPELQEILDRAAEGDRITAEQALAVYRDAPFHALGRAADAARRRRYAGTERIATYIIERNINYTNVCVTACKFCAFYRAPKHEGGWVRDLDDILRRCAETVELGGTQIMFQGGHHPDFGVEYYETAFAAIKQAFPQLVLHSLGASEVAHMARVSGVGVAEAIARIRAAGLDSFAGAGAELLPERARTAIAPLKESGEEWLSIMETAHRLGVESDWVLFGHVHRCGPLVGDEPADWLGPAGTPRLVNSGSWVYEPLLVHHASPPRPYWPGGAIVLDDGQDPRAIGLLDHLDAAALH